MWKGWQEEQSLRGSSGDERVIPEEDEGTSLGWKEEEQGNGSDFLRSNEEGRDEGSNP